MTSYAHQHREVPEQGKVFNELSLAVDALRQQAIELLNEQRMVHRDQAELLERFSEAIVGEVVASSASVDVDGLKHRIAGVAEKFLAREQLKFASAKQSLRKEKEEALLQSAQALETAIDMASGAKRERLPDQRPGGKTHKFSINNGMDIYIIVGEYEDGRPGEVFLKAAKQGSTLGGLLNGIAILTSIGLQYGVPIKVLAEKFTGSAFEPSGQSSNPEIGEVTSILDYIYRWLDAQYSQSS